MKLSKKLADRQLVQRTQLQRNDLWVIQTKNSEYKIQVVDNATFVIIGGWFDKKGLSPFRCEIEGATWGWGDIAPEIIARTGMRIKFSNGLTTSPVKKILHHKQ